MSIAGPMTELKSNTFINCWAHQGGGAQVFNERNYKTIRCNGNIYNGCNCRTRGGTIFIEAARSDAIFSNDTYINPYITYSGGQGAMLYIESYSQIQ